MPPWHTLFPMDATQTEAVFELAPAEEEQLFQVARAALEAAVRAGLAEDTWLPPMETSDCLQEESASFVTLRIDGTLRGCIGSVQANRPLVLDVARNAMRAALYDPRFEPVTPEELPHVEIEISILTPPLPLEYGDGPGLIARIRPHIDGVMIVHGLHRGILLPQTWNLIPDPTEFMAALCCKAGLPDDAYRDGDLEVYTFQVQTICEK